MSILDVEGPPAGVAARVSVRSRLRAVVDELSSLMAGFDPADVTGSEAAALTVAFAEVERLAMAGKTLVAGRVAETGHHRAAGFDTAARWLADRTKASGWEASRTIETARCVALSELALTREALVAGALTATSAHEIATAAAKAPDEQARLLAFAARETTARLKDECRALRLTRKAPEDPQDRAERIKAEMMFSHRELGDGLSELVARMPTSWLALALAAVNAQCEAVFERARAEGRTDAHQVYMVEALVTLVLFGNLGEVGKAVGGGAGDDATEEFCEGPSVDPTDGPSRRPSGSADDEGDLVSMDDAIGTIEKPAAGARFEAQVFEDSEPVDDDVYDHLLAAIRGGPAPPGQSRSERRRRSNRRGRCRCGGRVTPRAKIIIRVDQSALVRGYAVAGELCDIPGIGPVPVATVRELWPEAVVKVVVTRGVDVVNVTSLGRRATEAMETALQFSSPRCSNIACDHDRFVELDHRLGYSNVGRTQLDELDPLCSNCHGLKSNENWQLVAGAGRRRFVPPSHDEHPGDPPTMKRRG